MSRDRAGRRHDGATAAAPVASQQHLHHLAAAVSASRTPLLPSADTVPDQPGRRTNRPAGHAATRARPRPRRLHRRRRRDPVLDLDRDLYESIFAPLPRDPAAPTGWVVPTPAPSPISAALRRCSASSGAPPLTIIERERASSRSAMDAGAVSLTQRARKSARAPQQS
jgi:hypothetical protein